MEEPVTNSPEGYENSLADWGGFQERAGLLEIQYERNKEFKNIIDNLNGDEKILDLGSGLGSGAVRFLRTLGKAKDVVSLDLDFRNLLVQNKEKAPGNILVNADAASAPFASGSIDIVVQSMLKADNATNDDPMISTFIDQEIHRVLKPGGYL